VEGSGLLASATSATVGGLRHFNHGTDTVKRSSFAIFALTLCAASPLPAQRSLPPDARIASAMRADALWAPLKFLADDLLEGRGTGRRGGELAAQFIASQFMALGLEPAGDNGTYFQNVPIVSLNPSPTLTVTGGASPRDLRYRDEFVAWAERPDTLVKVDGELVFVGYGITAPEWQWDDFKGVDLKGKVILMLVNDPGLRDPSIFRGKILTYYGRWTYKLEEAARHGAAGALLVHNDTMASYGWNTVRNSWTGEQVRLDVPPGPLAFAGWLTQSVAAELLRSRGLDLAQLMATAQQRDFHPVPTGLMVGATVRSTLKRMTTPNVIGRLPGSDPALKDELVVISAHWDHFGIGQPVNGDSIRNGAVDNASGVATMLGVADAFVRSGLRPKRSLLFVGIAGEESGLLGSSWLATHPPVPLAKVAADLNVDVANLYGATRDISAMGSDQSTLGRIFERAALAERLRVTVDSQAMFRGGFFRSDHFPFSKAGVPSLSWGAGDDFVGKPAEWGRQQKEIYNRERYHQPADNLLPWYTPDGAVQQARVLIRVAWAVADGSGQPTWNPTSEFAAAGRRRTGQ
jgi:Zn-dependent M28 family amino/carboxypeptidase